MCSLLGRVGDSSAKGGRQRLGRYGIAALFGNADVLFAVSLLDPGDDRLERVARCVDAGIVGHLHLQDADGFYEQLLDAHEGLTREQSEMLNARLILLLANQVGDAKVLKECVEAAATMRLLVSVTNM